MKRLPALRSLWLVIAFGLTSTAAVGVVLWHLHRDALDTQLRELDLLALALTDDLERGLRGAEEGLRAIRDEVRARRLPVRGPDAEAALRTRADLMPLVTSIWLLDRDRRVMVAADALHPPELDAFDPPLERLTGAGVALGRPFTPKAGDQPMVAVALRIVDGGDDDPAWIVAALPAQSLLGAFSATSPASDARMAVFRGDGARLAGSVVDSPRLGEAVLAGRLADLPRTSVRRFADGSERLVGHQATAHYALSVVLTREVDAVLAPWRQAALLIVAGLFALIGVLVIAWQRVARAERRHEEAQRAIAAQAARASKLESLGSLAGGVAHDFNNVLAAIVGYAEMAQEGTPAGTDASRHVGKVLQAALRGKALVERVLAFSRGGGRKVETFELEPLVVEVLSMLTASLSAGVVLERDLQAPGATLRGDATQVFEAVMNLCTNAMQAMPKGGRLRVQVRRERVATARVLSHSRIAPGNYIAVAVSDDGVGIAADAMERLFEPFFTTRRASSGTGLGLAVVHGVVAEAGGGVDVLSVPGQGAQFTLFFPDAGARAAAPASAPLDVPRGAGQLIVVIDDEADLVELGRQALEGLGYRVLAFQDAGAALRAVQAEPARVAAVVTDEVMPGMNGTQFTERLRETSPTLPVLLVTGYGGALLATRAATVGVTRILTKPLQRAELARALADVLA